LNPLGLDRFSRGIRDVQQRDSDALGDFDAFASLYCLRPLFNYQDNLIFLMEL
jgi:hypothetical protein